MVPLSFPIVLIGLIIDTLAGNKYFSVLDMTSGFWQCPLSLESRKYTAYSTQSGHFQYKVCPQGIRTGPAWFNLCVSRAMSKCKGFAMNYFDDIVIFSKSLSEHINHIISVMKELKKFGFKISAEKSTWIRKEVALLGYVISGTTIKINPEKIATIKNRTEPKNAKQVECVLGLFQFYSQFIDQFAEKSKVLRNLTRKDVEFEWTEECRKAFRYFVDRVTSEPIMAQPILGKPFKIYSDGSKTAVGGTLCQIINGQEHVIKYASRLLKGSELNYGISDIECLAVVFLVKKWHHYLYGIHFEVYTDHIALLNLMNIRDYHGRLGRQAMFLQEYHFTVKYIPGKDNTAADATSRPVLAIETRSSKQLEKDKIQHDDDDLDLTDPNEDLALKHYIMGKNLPGLSHKQIKRIMRIVSKYSYSNEDNIFFIHKDNKWKTVPKLELRRDLILKAHCLGHFENETVYNRLKEKYFWKGMIKDIDHFVKRCTTCQRMKTMTPIEHGAKAFAVNGIFERIGMDLTGGFPESQEGYSRILVIIEYMTKVVRLYPMKTKRASEVAEHLWTWITEFGPPKFILSDQGTEFVNETITALLDKVGTERRVTSAYSPRTDGLCERANQTIVRILANTRKEIT